VTQRFEVDGVDFTDPLTPSEVARLFAVDPKTVTRWAEQGRLASIRTPGKHRRFSRSQVEALLRGELPSDVPP
jgi:excisionase family DNA binding protein